MDPEEIKQLIAFHQSALDQYRQLLSPSTQVLSERTIVALKELLQQKGKEPK